MLALILIFSLSLSIYSATITASSCEYVHVKNAYNNTTVGDSLVIPEGSSFWDSTLNVTHGLVIIGPGSDKITITNSQTSNKPWNYLFRYEPDLITINSNSEFEITGFRFKTDGKDNNAVIAIYSEYLPTNLINIRIHHNTFDGGTDASKYMFKAIELRGGFCGLVDNNRFINVRKVMNSYGLNASSWNALYPSPIGSSQNVYVEANMIENTINDKSVCCSGVISSGQGGRIVIRYNQWNGIFGYSVLDAHGNQTGGVVGSLLLEAYGNRFEFSESNKMLDLRGGVGIVFYNFGKSDYSNIQTMSIRDEHDDANLPNVIGIEHVHDSYFWKNTYNMTDITPVNDIDINDEIDPNEDWWNYTELFDGTSGIGFGPLSKRPTTCVTGVGYWATEQPSSVLSEDNFGINPKTPIKGTLYRCTKTNVWEPYYRPYTYPHPLAYEKCSIDSVVVNDTIKIFGNRFLSIPGDSGFVKINNSAISVKSWTDTLIKVTYTGFVEKITVRNAGKYVAEKVLSDLNDDSTKFKAYYINAGLQRVFSAGISKINN